MQQADSLFVMVGDPSADRHGARVIRHLKQMRPDINVWGVGGSHMADQGVELLYNCQDFSALGIEDVIKNYFFFRRMGSEIVEAIRKRAPDLVLLIDFGAFNLRLANELKRQFPNLPIYYFISPQVWGSRPWRMDTLAKTISKMLVIFPFEESVWKAKNVPVAFVGHPLTREFPDFSEVESKESYCQSLGINPLEPLIAVFAGSRNQEISDLMPISLDAMARLLKKRPNLQFAVAQANDRVEARLRKTIEKAGMSHLLGHNLFISQPGRNHALLIASDLVWAKSGTTTLEVTLFGKPMLIYYKAMWLSFTIFCLLKQVKRVGWPNILAGYDLVPELLQLDCRADQLVRYTCDLLDVPTLRREMSEKLLSLRAQLGERDYTVNCVNEIVKAISDSKNQIGTTG